MLKLKIKGQKILFLEIPENIQLSKFQEILFKETNIPVENQNCIIFHWIVIFNNFLK